MHVEIIVTGNELLSGRITDAHVRALAEALRPLGLAPSRVEFLPDDTTVIRTAVETALRQTDLLFITGGLGPTCDDVTREAVAAALGRGIVTDAPTLRHLDAMYARMGRPMNASRARQACVVEGAEVLPNSAGAAPGQRLVHQGRVLYLLPGPPNEFHAVLATILPRLKASAVSVPEHLFKICGPGESDIATRLEQAGFDPGPLNVAYCARPGHIELRLQGQPGDGPALAVAVRQVRAVLGVDIFTEADESLAMVVGRRLGVAKARVAVAESCTGGGLGQRLTTVPGSSEWFAGGVVTYANTAKRDVLGVPQELLDREGAVSEPVAACMARAVRDLFQTEFALSITGVAGPGGGTERKPVGLVYFALADARNAEVRHRVFPGDREAIREWSIQFALDLLRRRLQEEPRG